MDVSWLSELSIQDWRDLLAIPLGFAGMALLLWRSLSADRQASAARKQMDLAAEQLRSGQQDALDARYRRIADMLGSETISTRVGGIHSLKHLMTAHPEKYHMEGMELLCAFIRAAPSFSPSVSDNDSLREDVQAAMSVIGSCAKEAIRMELVPIAKVDLDGADLAGLKLSGANLSGARLAGANLANSKLHTVDLSDALLEGAELSGADFINVNLAGAHVQHARCDHARFSSCRLVGAKIDGARIRNAQLLAIDMGRASTWRTDFSGSKFQPAYHSENNADGTETERDEQCSVAQRQLDVSVADPANVPEFDRRMVDPDTGKALEWDRERCGREWAASRSAP